MNTVWAVVMAIILTCPLAFMVGYQRGYDRGEKASKCRTLPWNEQTKCWRDLDGNE